jgi:hypothetical protein
LSYKHVELLSHPPLKILETFRLRFLGMKLIA